MECTCFWVRDVPNPIAYDAERLLPNGAEGPLNELNDPGEDLEPVQRDTNIILQQIPIPEWHREDLDIDNADHIVYLDNAMRILNVNRTSSGRELLINGRRVANAFNNPNVHRQMARDAFNCIQRAKAQIQWYFEIRDEINNRPPEVNGDSDSDVIEIE